MTPGWYLVSYDISNAKRGQRVQRLIRKSGVMLLESLYLCAGSGFDLERHLTQLRHLAGASARNVVVYRLRGSQPIHVAGTACPAPGIYEFGSPTLKAHSAA